MKKIARFCWILMTLPLMAVTCNKNPEPELPCEVSFSAQIKALNTRATDTAFEQDDEISVFACYNASLASTNYAHNVRYTFTDNLFEASSPITYPDKDAALAFYAVYPFDNYSTPKLRFSVSDDQSQKDAYTESDLMTASIIAKDQEEVALKFSHKLAKVVIRLDKVNIPDGEQSVKFCKVYTALDADIADNVFEETGSRRDVISCPDGSDNFKVILPPQKISAGSLFAEIRVGDKTYDWVADTDIYLSSGVEHIYTATLKETTVTITSYINDWNEVYGEVDAERNKNK